MLSTSQRGNGRASGSRPLSGVAEATAGDGLELRYFTEDFISGNAKSVLSPLLFQRYGCLGFVLEREQNSFYLLGAGVNRGVIATL